MQNATTSEGVKDLELVGSDGALVPMDEDDIGRPRQQGSSRNENSESRPGITIENHGIVVVGDHMTINDRKEKKNDEGSQIKLPADQLNKEVSRPENENKKQKRRGKIKSNETRTPSSPSKHPAVVARFNEIDKYLSTFRGNGNWKAHRDAVDQLRRVYARDEDNSVCISLLNYEEAAAFCDRNEINAALKIVNKLGHDMKVLITTQRSDLKHINDTRLIVFCKCLFLASKLHCMFKNFGKAKKALDIANVKLSECNNVELKVRFHLANAYLQLSLNQSHCTSERASHVIEHTNKAEQLWITLEHERYEKIKRKMLLLRCKAIIQFYQDDGDKEKFATMFSNSIKELECDRLWRDISRRQKVDFEIIKSNYFKIRDNDAQALDHAKEALQISQECEFKKEVSLLQDQIRKLENFPNDLVGDGEGLVKKVLAIQTTTDGHAESNAAEMPDSGVFSSDDSDFDTYHSLRQNEFRMMPQIEENINEEEIDS